jgi:protease-4
MSYIDHNSSDVVAEKTAERGRKPGRGLITVLVIIAVIICFVLCACFGMLILASSTSTKKYNNMSLDENHKLLAGKEGKGDKFLVVNINGVIMMDSDNPVDVLSASSGVTYGYDVKRQLASAAEDTTIKGILLEINSPGGTVVGAQAIVDGIAQYREKTGKPVIAHCSGLCASAAYESAAATDHIMVDNGSLAGSIGVIVAEIQQYNNVVALDGGLLGGGVVTKDGIQQYYITGGKYKDSGNPFRPLTDEEKKIYQESANLSYDQFVKYISQRRGISEATIKNEIMALAYGDQQALRNKLIDAIGSKQDAYAELARRANSKEYYVISRNIQISFLDAIFMNTVKPYLTREEYNAKEGCELCNQTLALYGDPMMWNARVNSYRTGK